MRKPGEDVDHHPVDEEAVALNISRGQLDAWVRGCAARIARDPNSRDEVAILLTDLCYDPEIQQWINAHPKPDHFYLGSEAIRRICDRLIVLFGSGKELSMLLEWAGFRIVFDDAGMWTRRVQNLCPQFPPDLNRIAAFNLILKK